MSNQFFNTMKQKIMTGGIDFSSTSREIWAALVDTDAIVAPQYDDYGDSTVITRRYRGIGRDREIFTYKSINDFSKKGNGTGFYFNKALDRVMTDDDTISDSGTVPFDGTEISLKRIDATVSWFRTNSLIGFDHYYNPDVDSFTWFNDTAEIIETTPNGFVLHGTSQNNVNNSEYIVYQKMYDTLKWGLAATGECYVEMYNSVDDKGIIMYIGTTAATSDIPHSCTTTPKTIEFTNLSNTSADTFFFEPDGLGDCLRKATTAAEANSTAFTGVTADATNVVLFGNNRSINYIGDTFLCEYTGQNNAYYGAFSYTADGTNKELVNFGVGNNARRVTVKAKTTTGSWRVFDTVRKTNNYENVLYFDSNIGESTLDEGGITITPEGISSYDAGVLNTDGIEYIVLVEYDYLSNNYTNQPYTLENYRHCISDFDSNAIIQKGKIKNTSIVKGTMYGDNILFTNVDTRAKAVLIYEKASFTTADYNSFLICYIDTATGLPVTSDESNVVIEFTDRKIFGLG